LSSIISIKPPKSCFIANLLRAKCAICGDHIRRLDGFFPYPRGALVPPDWMVFVARTQKHRAQNALIRAFAAVASTYLLACRLLWFRCDARRYACLAHPYCAFGMAVLRGCYDQVVGPSRHLPKFTDRFCRHPDVWVHLHPHLIWQATEGYVKRSKARCQTAHLIRSSVPSPI
jgi:hypothetical protein